MDKSFTLITVYLIAFAGFTSFSLLFPVVPYYASSLGLSAMDVGFIVSIYSYVNAVAILPCGMLSDRWGRRTFLITGLVLSTLIPFLYPLARDMFTLCLVRALHGLGSAVFIPTALAVVTDVATPETRGRVLGWYTASAQLGLMAGPAAGGFLLQQFGFEVAFYGCSLTPLLGLIFISTRINAIHQKPAAVTGLGEHPWNWLRQGGAIISLVTLVLVAVGSGAISTFIPLYVREFGVTEAGAGIIITSCYLSSAALRIPVGNLSDRFGNAPLVMAGLALCAAGLGLIPFMHDLWLFALAALVFGTGMGFAMPASLTWLAHLSPVDKRGLSMGMGSAAFQVGLALGATSMGMVINQYGYTNMYFTAAGIVAAGLIVSLLVTPIKALDKTNA